MSSSPERKSQPVLPENLENQLVDSLFTALATAEPNASIQKVAEETAFPFIETPIDLIEVENLIHAPMQRAHLTELLRGVIGVKAYAAGVNKRGAEVLVNQLSPVHASDTTAQRFDFATCRDIILRQLIHIRHGGTVSDVIDALAGNDIPPAMLLAVFQNEEVIARITDALLDAASEKISDMFSEWHGADDEGLDIRITPDSPESLNHAAQLLLRYGIPFRRALDRLTMAAPMAPQSELRTALLSAIRNEHAVTTNRIKDDVKLWYRDGGPKTRLADVVEMLAKEAFTYGHLGVDEFNRLISEGDVAAFLEKRVQEMVYDTFGNGAGASNGAGTLPEPISRAIERGELLVSEFLKQVAVNAYPEINMETVRECVPALTQALLKSAQTRARKVYQNCIRDELNDLRDDPKNPMATARTGCIPNLALRISERIEATGLSSQDIRAIALDYFVYKNSIKQFSRKVAEAFYEATLDLAQCGFSDETAIEIIGRGMTAIGYSEWHDDAVAPAVMAEFGRILNEDAMRMGAAMGKRSK